MGHSIPLPNKNLNHNVHYCNCSNCGAPVNESKCEYCGTNYNVPETITDSKVKNSTLDYTDYIATKLQSCISYLSE